jgi:hypothetical protein
MSLVDRARNILVSPATEWPVIAGETTSTGTLLSGYALPLVVAYAVADFIGSMILGGALAIVGVGTGFFGSIIGSLIFVCMSIVSVYLLSIIINLLAPTFGGQKHDVQALKVAVYSMTAVWIAGLTQILPFIGGLITLIGCLYGIYLMYLGLTPVMKVPRDKAAGYTVVVVVVTLVLGAIAAAMFGTILGLSLLGGSILSAI